MMDAAMPAAVVRNGLEQPVMFLTRPTYDMRAERGASGGWTEKDIEQTLSSQQRVYEKATAGNGYFVNIEGMFHINFTDAPRYSPMMSGLGLIGPIDREEGFEIVNAYTLAFFDHALKQKTPRLLLSKTQYRHATLHYR
jgi:hypothetical protein